MSLERDITAIKELVEADIFKAASSEDLATRRAERLKALGPKVQKLVQLVAQIGDLEKEYEKVLEEFRAHPRAWAGGYGAEYHAGNFPKKISYKIKVHAWPMNSLEAICEEYDLKDTLDQYRYDMLDRDLEWFVGQERGYDRETGKRKYIDTGAGLTKDYQDLFDGWEQNGSSGGYLTLHLIDIGFEDMDNIAAGIDDGSIGADEVDEDFEFATGFLVRLKQRMNDIYAVHVEVERTVKSIGDYIESPEFGTDFFDHLSVNNYENAEEAQAEWEALIKPKTKNPRKK